MHRKPFTFLSLLAMLLLSAVGTPALGTAVTCTAGNPNANASETTPTAKFAVNGDFTVTHAKTGLMWKECAEDSSGAGCATGGATAMDWAGALNAANTANAANGGLGFANHTDWRLPNQKELQSIVESCGYNPSINQAMFPATPAWHFWSASSYVPDPALAWFVHFYDGYSGAYDKTYDFLYVRLVRGGQSLDSFHSLASTATVITSISPSPALTGQSYTVNVSVSSTSGTPTGTVSVSDGDGATCSISLPATSCNLVSTSKGGKTIAATYGGTSDYQASSASKAQTINPAHTATGLVVDANPVQVGTAVTLTATVTATSARAGTPFGTVTFNNGLKALGTYALNGAGVASMTFTPAAATYAITASYSGDGDYFKNSNSATRNLDVQDLPTVQFSAKSVNVKDTAGSVTLKVQRVGSTLGAVAVGYATANGTATSGVDYTAKSGTLNWAVGNAADKTVTITVLTRAGNQPNRVFNVTLSAPGGATLGTPSTEAVTVQK